MVADLRHSRLAVCPGKREYKEAIETYSTERPEYKMRTDQSSMNDEMTWNSKAILNH